MAWFYYGDSISKEEPINFAIEYTQDNKDSWPEVIYYTDNGKKYAKLSSEVSVDQLRLFFN